MSKWLYHQYKYRIKSWWDRLNAFEGLMKWQWIPINNNVYWIIRVHLNFTAESRGELKLINNISPFEFSRVFLSFRVYFLSFSWQAFKSFWALSEDLSELSVHCIGRKSQIDYLVVFDSIIIIFLLRFFRFSSQLLWWSFTFLYFFFSTFSCLTYIIFRA